ncbi:hypothetical protein LZ554_004896 [Drepanopeziza brunnea f. sp. 'monogermtubi']|nr:hypothetical protein LZ554_004896 [Drepanopeziza brunnea f. sp. 'monogermtubi']
MENTLPSPAPETKSTDDYSDIASDASEGKDKGRKYQRGGRKTSSTDTTAEELELLQGCSPDNDDDDDNDDNDYDEDGDVGQDPEPAVPCQYCAGSGTPAVLKERRAAVKKAPAEEPFDTGIRAFNIRKATGGGRRPISIRRPSSRKKSQAQAQATKGREKKREVQRHEEGDEEGDGNAAETEDGGTTTRKGGKKAREAPGAGGAGKPMSIRLDLNLMVEVFLKAKIQGDVTVTFLE